MPRQKEPPLFWQTQLLQKVVVALMLLLSVAAVGHLLAFMQLAGCELGFRHESGARLVNRATLSLGLRSRGLIWFVELPHGLLRVLLNHVQAGHPPSLSGLKASSAGMVASILR